MTFSLVVVTAAALLVPLLLHRFRINFLPTAVAEIIIGVIIGKSWLNLVHSTELLSLLSEYGVIFLLFLSGLEIDFSLFKKAGPPRTPLEAKKQAAQPKISALSTAIYAYVLTIITSLVLAAAFVFSGLLTDFWLATILFGTVALGVVIATLKENELLSKPLGQSLLLFAVFGEVIPMLALTGYATIYAGKGSSLWLLSIVFIAGAILFRRFRKFFLFYDDVNKATTQVDVRLASYLIFMLVVIAVRVGAEPILGAFVAGIVINLLQPGEETRQKLDAIGYGLLIPFFFILTGVNLNLRTLLSSSQVLALIPLIFIAFILSKLPAYFGFVRRFNRTNSISGALLSSSTITLVLTTLTVARNLNAITTEQYGAFIVAAIFTCLIGPPLFNRFFTSEPEDLQKKTVHFFGVNLLAITAAKQLNPDWYDVKMYTNNHEHYATYNSQIDLTLLDNFDEATLTSIGALDCDIFVATSTDYQTNFRVACAAKRYGVERVIARFDTLDITSDLGERMEKLGIEYYKTVDTSVAILRSLIETPATLQMLTGTDNRIYEVVVHNARYAGMQISDLPFVNDITVSRILRHGMSIAPKGDTTIQLGDHLLFLGNRDALPQVRQLLDSANE